MIKIATLLLALLNLMSCSSQNTTKVLNNQTAFEHSINQEIGKKITAIKNCFPFSYEHKEIIIYMNINQQGIISNITVLPLTSRPTQQCLSMTLSSLRLKKHDHKSYKIRRVIQL